MARVTPSGTENHSRPGEINVFSHASELASVSGSVSVPTFLTMQGWWTESGRSVLAGVVITRLQQMSCHLKGCKAGHV